MVAHVSISGRALQLRTLILYSTEDSGNSLEAAGSDKREGNPRGVHLEPDRAKMNPAAVQQQCATAGCTRAPLTARMIAHIFVIGTNAFLLPDGCIACAVVEKCRPQDVCHFSVSWCYRILNKALRNVWRAAHPLVLFQRCGVDAVLLLINMLKEPHPCDDDCTSHLKAWCSPDALLKFLPGTDLIQAHHRDCSRQVRDALRKQVAKRLRVWVCNRHAMRANRSWKDIRRAVRQMKKDELLYDTCAGEYLSFQKRRHRQGVPQMVRVRNVARIQTCQSSFRYSAHCKKEGERHCMNMLHRQAILGICRLPNRCVKTYPTMLRRSPSTRISYPRLPPHKHTSYGSATPAPVACSTARRHWPHHPNTA